MRFLPAANFTPHPSPRAIDLVVLHSMESQEKPDTADNVASWFAGVSAPRASAHFCVTPETPILTRALRWVPADQIQRGTELIGVDEFAPGRAICPGGRLYKPATVTALGRRVAPSVRLVLCDGRTVSSSTDHWWLSRQSRWKSRAWQWVPADALKPGDQLAAPLPAAWDSSRGEDLAWLSGFLDGEGCINRHAHEVSFGQADGVALEEAMRILKSAKWPFRFVWREPRQSGHQRMGIVSLSGMGANLELLSRLRPVRLLPKAALVWEGRRMGSRTYGPGSVELKMVEQLGEREVVSMETSSRTFIANGIVSHNCIDSGTIVQCVRERDIAWHAPGANRNGIGIEHAGRAAQTRAAWLDNYSLRVLELSARLVADLCRRHNVPAIFQPWPALQHGARGITTHREVSMAFKRSTHTDPGLGFPMDFYLSRVALQLGSPDPLGDLGPTQA